MNRFCASFFPSRTSSFSTSHWSAPTETDSGLLSDILLPAVFPSRRRGRCASEAAGAFASQIRCAPRMLAYVPKGSLQLWTGTLVHACASLSEEFSAWLKASSTFIQKSNNLVSQGNSRYRRMHLQSDPRTRHTGPHATVSSSANWKAFYHRRSTVARAQLEGMERGSCGGCDCDSSAVEPADEHVQALNRFVL